MNNLSAEKSFMLISKERGVYKKIDAKKISTGSFYTVDDTWLKSPIRAFLKSVLATNNNILDPFAGDGHILHTVSNLFGCETAGYDITNKGWPINDSLKHIPNEKKAIICTNPPYLAKHSANRKRVFGKVIEYYENFSDLYQVALACCLSAARFTVAIIPETFLNSNFPKHNLKVISIVSDNPFTDTENPVCVACFDSTFLNGEREAEVFIDDHFCFRFDKIKSYNRKSKAYSKVHFNNASGKIALKAVDGVNPSDRIHFCDAKTFYYSRDKIKVSSRLLTYIHIPSLDNKHLKKFLSISNRLLENIRSDTKDLILSPFKGNNKSGVRRRRLDYRLARLIIEETLSKIESRPPQKPMF